MKSNIKAFSAAILIISLFFLITASYLALTLELNFREKGIEYKDLSLVIEEQDKLIEIGENGLLLYCNSPIESNITTIFNISGCDLEFRGIKTRNCFFEALNTTEEFLRINNITSGNVNSKLQSLINQLGFNCNYVVQNISTNGCSLNKSFSLECELGDVESGEGIKTQKFKVKGGIV